MAAVRPGVEARAVGRHHDGGTSRARLGDARRGSALLGSALLGSALLGVSLLGLGCSGASFDGQVYRGQGLSFRLGPVPASWKALELDRGSLAYRDEARKAVIAVNGRCGRDGEDVPLSALTQHLFIQFTEREIRTEETVPFDGREARHTVLEAKLDGVKKTVDVWVLKKNGCVYDLVYVADPERYPEGAADFDRFARGFATLEPS